MDEAWLAGVDACAGGWLAAFVPPGEGTVRLRVFRRFTDLLEAVERPGLIAIDIPIGLPERIGRGGRAAETAVRPLLGARQSSVFSTPARPAIYAEAGWVPNVDEMLAAHARASEIARATSDPPKGVSIQAFCLFPKIREVDEVLRTEPGVARRVFETHPEVTFWRLNGETPLGEPKKVRGQPFGRGLALRRKLLATAGLPAGALELRAPPGAGEDDVLDALACAVTARRLRAGEAVSYPNPPETDPFGLPMAIWM